VRGEGKNFARGERGRERRAEDQYIYL